MTLTPELRRIVPASPRLIAGRAGSLLRGSALGISLVMPLVGAAAAGVVDRRAMLELVGVGLAFHCFAFVLNDVIDLPVDRTEPRRSNSALVVGAVRPEWALALALVQVPAAVGIVLLMSRGTRPIVALAIGFALLGVYNVAGKRCPLPPLTDLVQGCGWAALTLFGGAVVGPWTPTSWWVAAYVALYIVLINGVHGALRDLANDLRCGVRSTAIWMGARPDPIDQHRIVLPPVLATYGIGLHVLMGSILFVALVALPYGAEATAATAIALVILWGAASWFLAVAVRSAADPLTLRASGMLHLVATLAGPVVLLAAGMPPWLLLAAGATFAAPFAAHPWLPDSLRRMARLARSLDAAAVARLVRVENCMAASVATILGGYLGHAPRWWTIRMAVAAGSMFALIGAANVLNDITDISVDRLNKPWRPLPAGRVRMQTAKALFAGLSVAALGLAGSLGSPVLVAAAAMLALSVAYNRILKSTVLVGNAVVALVAAASIPYGALVTKRSSAQVGAAALLVFLFVLAGEVLKTLADRSADAQGGLRTVATQAPARVVIGLHRAVASIFAVSSIVPWLAGIASLTYLIVIVVGAVVPTLWVIALLRGSPADSSVRLALGVTKGTWLTGLAALLLMR
jgi:4-hydroxybenzoate polyprenyltransferase